MARLELDRLVKRYAGGGGSSEPAAVRELSLEVGDGELVCLLGPSGCGKTTTLRIIGGFLVPDEGDVRIDGQSVVRQPPERRPTAMVFQRYALWPHMTAWDNVAFGLKLRRQPRREVERRVQATLELVGLHGLGKRYPGQLSGGQQQRVALARALALEPRILLLDEPLSNLDAQLRVHMRAELMAIQRRVGITTVFVTHDQEEAMTLADRIAVMQAGALEQVAAPAQLYAEPATLFVAGFIGSLNLLDGTVSDGAIMAGPFRLPVPEGARLDRDQAVKVGIRPEDLVLRPDTDGAAGGPRGRVTQTTDLGHYRRAAVEADDGTPLVAFLAKGEEPAAGSRLRPERALIYRDERLVGVSSLP
jgi:putative spermidine/putrescine transport system ATP-binding protein